MVDEQTIARAVDVLRRAARPQRIIRFGSYARGRPTDHSDVDFLVQLERDRSLIAHVALMQDLEDLFGCRVDVVTERALQRFVRDRVLAEAVPL